jgi:CPA1 family monovalent cation:H+ antiporter
MFQAFVLSLLLLASGLIFPNFERKAEEVILSFDFAAVLLHFMLSFLLFAGALHVDLDKLKEEKWPILILATFGVVASTVVVGYLSYYSLQFLGYNIDLIACMLFGALISPTDPIAVLSILKQTQMSKNLEIKIAGESLFNDGVGVVVFLTVLAILQTGVENVTVASVSLLFLQEVAGGLLLGFLGGWACIKILSLISNEKQELEILFSVAMVLGLYRLGEVFEVSGPIATVVMGIYVGHIGHKRSYMGEHFYIFWDLIDSTLNAILFILIGFEILIINFEVNYLYAGAIATAIVLLARMVSVALPINLMSMRREFAKNTILILVWGGLRGGLSVALALSLPAKELSSHKDLLVSMTYFVVIFSILVQGLTIQYLLDKSPSSSIEQ